MLPTFLKVLPVLTLFALASAQEISRGACPEVTPLENGLKWDVNKYLGLWYEISRTMNVFEIGLKCVTANYTLRDGFIQVENQALNNKNKTSVAVGKARIDNPVNLLKVRFGKWQPEAPYWVVQTDFDRYALVMSCVDIFDTVKFASAWILSRSPSLSEKVLDDLFNKLSKLGIARSAMRMVDQVNCPTS